MPSFRSRTHSHDVPFEPAGRRSRLRRGGPRTPVPLLPLITVAAGIGIAYVSQTAHATKATYEVSRLSADQQRLRTQDRQLRDELARLQSSERIVAAAQQLGMEPASTWAYVASNPVHVLPVATQARVDLARDTDALRQLIAALSGVSGAEGSAGR